MFHKLGFHPSHGIACYIIKRADKICDVNVLEDPDYFVAIDNYNKAKTVI